MIEIAPAQLYAELGDESRSHTGVKAPNCSTIDDSAKASDRKDISALIFDPSAPSAALPTYSQKEPSKPHSSS